MKGIRFLGAAAISMLIVACAARAGGPPEIVVDRTACSHCGMLISELIYAAASQVPDAEARVFDDIGCLLSTMEAGQAAPRVWVQDAEGGGWIEGDAATFVTSPKIRTPMGGGTLAFRSADAAARAAAGVGGDVVTSLSALQARRSARQ